MSIRPGWIRSVLWLLLPGILWGCRPASSPAATVALPGGQVTQVDEVGGTVYIYIPRNLAPQAEVLVLVHGTPAKQESAESTARAFIQPWIDFSEKQGWVLMAPAFNQEDFSSREGDHALGGYRGLFGRRIAADAWVLHLVQVYRPTSERAEKPFYLYGHSAGGQFVGRFLVTHPEKVRRAVITAAATYPQPVEQVTWPFGMGALHTTIQWDASSLQPVEVIPDPQQWLAATQVPLTVIVGLNDISELPAYPGQKGKNRFTIARNWVNDMSEFARQHDLKSNFQFMMIPGKGHTMTGLLPYSQEALAQK